MKWGAFSNPSLQQSLNFTAVEVGAQRQYVLEAYGTRHARPGEYRRLAEERSRCVFNRCSEGPVHEQAGSWGQVSELGVSETAWTAVLGEARRLTALECLEDQTSSPRFP